MITTPAEITSQDAARPDALELTLTREQQDALVSALSDRNRTLTDIAEEFGASIEAISLYTARPEISKRLDAADQLVARRIRMQATKVLPLVIDTLTECVRSFQWEETHVLIDKGNVNVLEQRRRARESARKAGALLVRLSSFQSAPTRKPKPSAEPAPAPSGAPAADSSHPRLNNPSNNPSPSSNPRTLSQPLAPPPNHALPPTHLPANPLIPTSPALAGAPYSPPLLPVPPP